MLQVSVAIYVGENVSEGSMITVMNVETLPVDHTDVAGLWAAVSATIDRLTDDVRGRATDQAQQWARTAQQHGQ